MNDEGLELLISADELQGRIAGLAREIDADYGDTGLVLLCVLKSAAVFAVDLLRQLRCEVHHLEFLRATSYGAGTTSAGAVQVQSLLEDRHIAGKHVLIVDDIADTGHSCLAVTRYIRAMEPASIRCCMLLDKPERREVEIEYHYVGFTIPNHFVVGYGMDLAESYRQLPAIYYFPPP